MEKDSIVHICHSETGRPDSDLWLILHYTVKARSEDEKAIVVQLERKDKNFPTSEYKTLPDDTITMVLDKSKKEWEFVHGVNSEHTTLWPYIYTKLCILSECINKGKDGMIEFYFGP